MTLFGSDKKTSNSFPPISFYTATMKHLGYSVDRIRDEIGLTKRRLLVVATVTVAVGFLSFSLMMVVIEKLIMGRNPDWDTEKQFDELENPYEDIIKQTIPPVQAFYRNLQVDDQERPLIPNNFVPVGTSPTNDTSCLEAWFEEFETHVPTTEPNYIRWILSNMGLDQSIPVQKHLDDFLREPQDLAFLYNSSKHCLSQMHSTLSLACALMENAPVDFSIVEQRHYLVYSVHLAVILEVLTSHLTSDFTTRLEVIRIMSTSQRRVVEDRLSMIATKEMKEFRLAKFQGIAKTMQLFAAAETENVNEDSIDPLQINILEATKLDIEYGYEANARVGLALAAKVTFGSSIQNNKLTWPLGLDWIDAYMNWNMAFVVGALPPIALTKLFVPAVACPAVMDDGRDWLVVRTISLALGLMLVSQEPDPALEIPPDVVEVVLSVAQEDLKGSAANTQSSSAIAAGQTNLQSIMITSPPHDDVESMLFRLCRGTCHDGSWAMTDTIPHAHMSDRQFTVYVAFLVWFTVIITGLSMELLVWVGLLQGGWSSKWEIRWKLAQLMFALLVIAAVGLASYKDFMAVPLVAIGVYKFGFPETWTYLYIGLFDEGISRVEKLANLLNGLGMVIHHASLTLALSFGVAGVIDPYRAVVSPVLIPLVQHWFVLLKYVHQNTYIIIELFLEVWFEWMIFSQFEYFYSIHWSCALVAVSMISSHWIFLTAAALELYEQHFPETKNPLNNQMQITRQLTNIEGNGSELLVDTSIALAKPTRPEQPK